MKSVHVCPPITLSFGLPYTLMRLRRSVLRRSRRIPERRIVEKLSMFSSYIVFFFFIVFFILLSSYSSSSFPSPSLSLFFTHLQFFFFFFFSTWCYARKTDVSNWYQNKVAFYSSTHPDFKCKYILRRKTRLKVWKEHAPRNGDFVAPRFATSHPIYPPGCSGPWNVSRYRRVRFSAPDASRSRSTP